MNLAAVAVRGIEPNVAGIGLAVVHETKIVVVLRRIYFHSLRKIPEHPAEHLLEVAEGHLGLACRLLEIDLVGRETWALPGPNAGRALKNQLQRERKRGKDVQVA